MPHGCLVFGAETAPPLPPLPKRDDPEVKRRREEERLARRRRRGHGSTILTGGAGDLSGGVSRLAFSGPNGKPTVPSSENGKPPPPKPGPFKVPAWKNHIVSQGEMDEFMSHHGKTKPKMRKALAETFAAEGGFKLDRLTGRAFAGITQAALEQIKKSEPSLKDVRDVRSMTKEQVAKAYRAYFGDAFRRYGGPEVLESLNDPKTPTAFADTLFLHGQNRGARIIKDATNEMIRDLPAGQRDRLGLAKLTDQTNPKDTLDAMRRLTGAGLGRDVRWKIGDVRKRHAKNKRLEQRIDHFRF